ncbi:uncharacterized protein [Diadema antillarum]|uniref:uncharacterized protein n=1 Tax=Diadema antillarum TaxID=105358 RepID=UPI003A839653
MDLSEYIELGEKYGLQGEKLLTFAREERDKEVSRREANAARDERQKQREEQLKLAEEATKQKQLELEIAECNKDRHSSSSDSDSQGFQSALPLMQAFNENSDDLDAYILRFERHATLSKWPKGAWAPALGNLLTGRALECYTRLPTSEAEHYDSLKHALLQHFALNAEGFRKRFREAKQKDGESFAQFAARVSGYAKSWVERSECSDSAEALLDLCVQEQLFASCTRELAIFIRERTPGSVQDFVKHAELYFEARGLSDQKCQAAFRANQPKGPRCHSCGRWGHIAPKCPTKGEVATKYPPKQPTSGKAKTGGSCLTGLCPDAPASEVESGKADAIRTAKLICGHELLVLNSGHELGPDNVPTCQGRVNGKSVTVLRDTGCNAIVVRRSLVGYSQMSGELQPCVLMDGTIRRFPLAFVDIHTPYLSGNVKALCMDNPVYDLIVGNVNGVQMPVGVEGRTEEASGSYGETASEVDMETQGRGVDMETQTDAGSDGGAKGTGVVTERREQTTDTTHNTGIGASVETRGMRRRKEQPWRRLKTPDGIEIAATRDEMLREQERDVTLEKVKRLAVSGENKIVGKGGRVRYFYDNSLLYRQYESPHVENGKVFKQLVVPKALRESVLHLAHDMPLAGHLQTRKTLDRVMSQFYWPGIQSDVKRYCASCDACQRTTPKGRVGKVPLVTPQLIDTCFRRVAVDIIGPLQPITDKGNRYILTLVDLATRYPEAIALPSIEAERVAEGLMEVFSRLGFPNEMLSDNGTQFTAGVMREAARLVGIKQFYTTPYHPMANGACERFNGTLKQMLRRMCQERPKDWDRYLPALLFSYREVPHESTGYSPFELMYGRIVRGPMTILRELWTEEIPEEEVKTTYQYVLDLRDRLQSTCEVARSVLEKSSLRYKKHFDVRARERRFEKGDKALLLLPTSSNKLEMQWQGPFEVVGRVARHNYKLRVKGKEKTYHANLMKKYQERAREESVREANHLRVIDEQGSEDEAVSIECPSVVQTEGVSDVHISDELSDAERKELVGLVKGFADVMTDVPGHTNLAQHTVQLKTEEPIRSRPFPVPQSMKETIQEEVNTMLDMKVIEPSTSPYAAPVVLVPKKDGKVRFCVDYRKLNSVTVIDNEPIPNVEEIMSEIGEAKYFSKIDLSKGYWQIPVDERDREKTAFVTPEGQYQFRVLPFGMVNAPAVFTRMMRKLLAGLPHVVHYIDDVLVYSKTWEEHVDDLRRVFQRLREAHLTARPSKCHLGCRSVEFLGHIVEGGRVKPTPEKLAKVKSMSRPTTKREVRSLLGLVGYYRKFIPNMAAIAAPLTDLTKKNQPEKVRWGEVQEHAFQTLQDRLCKYPILRLPNRDEEYVVRTDASDIGIGAVLMQKQDSDLFPVSYASRKLLDRERKYAIVERECLALAWAVKKFSYYLYGRKFTYQTDHYPLAYLSKAQHKNARVLRWALALQAYDYRVQVIKGSENVGADYLSRCP